MRNQEMASNQLKTLSTQEIYSQNVYPRRSLERCYLSLLTQLNGSEHENSALEVKTT